MRNPHLWHLQVISLFLALTLLLSISAQESKQPPPQAPPTTLQPTDSRAPALAAAPTEAAPLQELAARLLQHANDVGCQDSDCTILVMNFVLPDGNTSRYSMQFADGLSAEIAKQENSIKVIDRSLLQGLLQRDRIPSWLQNSEPIAPGNRFRTTRVPLAGCRRDSAHRHPYCRLRRWRILRWYCP